VAVVIPFESRDEPSIDRLVDLVAADMQRVNGAILARTGSEVTMIPEVANHLINSGGKRLRPILTLALARLTNYGGDGHIKLAAAVEFMHTTTLSTRASCAAGASPRACCGATRPASWSAIFCSARRSR
jgi:octaprenyl-diphosphate synthase